MWFKVGLINQLVLLGLTIYVLSPNNWKQLTALNTRELNQAKIPVVETFRDQVPIYSIYIPWAKLGRGEWQMLKFNGKRKTPG